MSGLWLCVLALTGPTTQALSFGGAQSSRLGLRVAKDGSQFTVDVDGVPWLQSAPTFLQANGAQHESGGRNSSTAGQARLALTNYSGAEQGDDRLGGYVEYRWSWATEHSRGEPVRLETAARVYVAHPSILWTQKFPDGVSSFGFGDAIDLSMRKDPTWGTPGSAWPALRPAEAPQDLEFVTFLGDGSAQFGTGLSSATMPVERGAAVGYFNNTGATLVLSPASSFLSTVMAKAQHTNTLHCGVQGAALSLPRGHSTSFLMHAGPAVPDAFMSWGDRLLAIYNKPRPAPNSSISLEYLGYSSTAAYFYAHRKNETYEETMLAVKAFGEKLKLPYKWMLIDSWWYHENAVPGPQDSGVCFGGFGGTTWQWDSKPIPPAANCSGNFPTGWRGFAAKLNLPMMLHISEWAGSKISGKAKTPNPYGPPPYSRTSPSDWVVEDACSAPQTESFWDGIFKDMSYYGGQGGLAVFKQDHGGGEIVQLEAAQRNVSVMHNWLTLQAQAAEKHGVTKMLCGSISSFWTHAASIKAATHTRAGNDYLPGIALKEPCQNPNPSPTVFAGRDSNARISMSNMINWAVGLYPYKDTFFSQRQDWSSSTCLVHAGGTSPPYYGMQEPHPELQALVSAMSAGPVAPGDVIGSSNRSLIMRTCREDGVLLKPDHPAFPPGALFLKRLRGAGEVQLTSTTIDGAHDSSMTWRFLLSFAMSKAVALSLPELGVDEKLEAGVAWSRTNSQPFASIATLQWYGPGLPALSLPMQEAVKSGRGCCSWGLYTFWRLAPTSCRGKGWTLLGELGKMVSMSAQRIVAVTEAACDASDGPAAAGPSLVVDVVGQPQEVVTLSLLPPGSAASAAAAQGRLQPPSAVEVVELTVSANGKATVRCSAKCTQVP